MASDLLDIWKNIVIEETNKNNKKNGSLERNHSMKVEGKSEKAETVKAEKVQNSQRIKVDKVLMSENDRFERVNRIERTNTEKVSRSEAVKVEKVDEGETVKVEKIGGSESVRVEQIHKEAKHATGSRKLSSAPITPPKLTSMIKSNDSLRDKLREILAEAFSKVSSEADEDMIDEVNACDPIRVAVSVESVMFEKLGRSNGPQKFKYRSIMFNLKDANNPDLRRRVLLGQVKPERLINMTPEEMASDQRKRENNQIKEKALFDCERGGPPKATTDQFKCGRCGQRKTTYYQLQTRSADEPMTTFVTCVNCNNHWKFC